MFESFEGLSDDARLWVYALDRSLSGDEEKRVNEILGAFLVGWESHGVLVSGVHEIVDGRFVLIAGHCPSGIGGCAIDSSVSAIREIERVVGVDALGRALVYFRDGGGRMVSASRTDFKAMVDQGHVTADTTVVDTTIQTLGELRSGGLEKPFEESWHARAFGTV